MAAGIIGLYFVSGAGRDSLLAHPCWNTGFVRRIVHVFSHEEILEN